MNQLQRQAEQYEISIEVLRFILMNQIEPLSGEADRDAESEAIEEIAKTIDKLISEHGGKFSFVGAYGTKDEKTRKGKRIQINVTVEAEDTSE